MSRAEAVKLAREGIDALNDNRHAMPPGWLPDDARLVCTALLATVAELERKERVVESFVDAVERAERANEQRGRGGQHVPFHGDFCNASPSVRVALKRYARDMKDALASDEKEG
jgi:hypothetical protein